MVNRFRQYFTQHGQPVDENPSPGNKDGGISSLAEKSLGCVQKGGEAPITSVIEYGRRVEKRGLTLLDGPGNDQVSTTALVAAGAVVVLFTTGRGTPLGSPVPTVKVASNTPLFEHKPGWIDFNAGALLDGDSAEAVDTRFAEKVLAVASGTKTKNEERGYREIAIFKSGVTL
jgi:altronate hydrolase